MKGTRMENADSVTLYLGLDVTLILKIQQGDIEWSAILF